MREERSHTGTVLGPRRPLMKTELKADKGTPAPMARNPAAGQKQQSDMVIILDQVSMRSLEK